MGTVQPGSGGYERISDKLTSAREATVTKYQLLSRVSFGSPIAEQEQKELTRYFVQTNLWTEVRKGRIDIILGEKGSGKSAIFLLLQADQATMSVGGTYLISAENPRGDAAFRNLVEVPPADEREIELVWRMYFLVLVTKFLVVQKSESREFFELNRILVNAGLMDSSSLSLGEILSSVRRFVRRVRKVGFSFSVDPHSFAPSISPELVLSADQDHYNEVANKLGELYVKAETALNAKSYTFWILIDRLDLAFESSPELEKNALRALLRTYSAMNAYPHIKLKIFLRSDLFELVTADGFREASHIAPKSTELSWDDDGILDVIIRRALSNNSIVDYYKLDPETVKKSFAEKEILFKKMFPARIGEVPTLDWILRNMTDGRGNYCPRDVIEFMNTLTKMQMLDIERGFSEPTGDMLFSETLFDDAFSQVSKQKCNTVLYAEYPKEKRFIDMLKNTNCEFTLTGLAHLWSLTEDEAIGVTQRLMRIGLFRHKHNLTLGNFEVSRLYQPGAGSRAWVISALREMI